MWDPLCLPPPLVCSSHLGCWCVAIVGHKNPIVGTVVASSFSSTARRAKALSHYLFLTTLLLPVN